MTSRRLLKIQSILLTGFTLAASISAAAWAVSAPGQATPATKAASVKTVAKPAAATKPNPNSATSQPTASQAVARPTSKETPQAAQAPMVRVDTRIVINVPSRHLWVYEGDKLVRYFPVGVGRVGFMTPVGKYSVLRKVVDPGWENPYMSNGKMRIAPGETNPLGTRWIGFLQNAQGEFGIHGTDNPGSVGKFSSHGCVRMKVSDAEALFDLVDVGTPVEVVYQPVLIRRQGDNVRLVVYADRFHKGMPSADKIKADILKEYPHAEIDDAKIQSALATPMEKPMEVAHIAPIGDKAALMPEPPTLKTSQQPLTSPGAPALAPLESNRL